MVILSRTAWKPTERDWTVDIDRSPSQEFQEWRYRLSSLPRGFCFADHRTMFVADDQDRILGDPVQRSIE